MDLSLKMQPQSESINSHVTGVTSESEVPQLSQLQRGAGLPWASCGNPVSPETQTWAES